MATYITLGVLLFFCVVVQGGSALIGNATQRQQQQQQAIDSYELVYNPCNNIRQAGFVCVDCGTLGYCLHVDNQWQTVEMTTCKTEGGFYCSDEGSIGCAWGMQCTVPVRGKFYCQQPGMYPDPYDCRSYHECSELNIDTPRRCQNGYAYSTLTESCTMPTTSDTCMEKQYECNYVGQMGAWSTNPRFYYVCQREQQGDVDIYYPLMMHCNTGYEFNGRVCVPEQTRKRMSIKDERVEGGQEEAVARNLRKVMLAIETKSVNAPARVARSAVAADESVDACTSVYEIKANANDCNSYMVCQQGVWTSFTCPEGAHFDANYAVCRIGSCNSATTDSGTGTAITNGKCQRIGMTADLTDCNKFYYCAQVSGDMEHKSCPAGRIYDSDSYVCVVGSC